MGGGVSYRVRTIGTSGQALVPGRPAHRGLRRRLIPSAPNPSAASGDVVQVAPDRWNFRRSVSGRPFVPAGVNYDHDMSAPCPLLLEEYWHDRWADVERDFREIADLGFNAVRVHCSSSSSCRVPERRTRRTFASSTSSCGWRSATASC
jgi:hypothetical protein